MVCCGKLLSMSSHSTVDVLLRSKLAALEDAKKIVWSFEMLLKH